MKMALRRTAIATSTVAFATLLSLNWSQERGISLSVESAQARVYGRHVNRSYYVTGRPTLISRYYGGYAAGNYYCSYGAGCGYGSLGDYYRSFAIPGFPASLYGGW